MKRTLLLLVLTIFFLPAFGQPTSAPKAPASAAGLAAVTAGLQKMPGFIPMYWDAKKGKIWLELNQLDTELLYYPSLAAGVGSNDIGLDRGRLSPAQVVKFQRSGNKVLLVALNYGYRALSRDAQEQQAVAESFAQSVLWGFEVGAEEGGRVLVDASAFFLQDAVGAGQAISQAKQGTYRLDGSRSAFYLPRTKNFPQNTEVEVTITLVGEQPGPYLREVIPSAGAVTMRQHHSFVQLPDDKYVPRAFDPRTGVGAIEYFDYATPVSEPIVKRFMRRHRLEKKDPTAAVSEAVKPIIYYVDAGTPEPIRSALVEGTSWWNQAFEAAGYKNAFQVKLLPADADPMDVRYNIVQWVHRSTRGWSYGGGITDPRTGEIIKGKVTLGSLRVRQDFLLAQGLIGDFDDKLADLEAGKSLPPAMMELCMARMRQLAAHEVGHTLGLPHNYIANLTDRTSVMDYPHPLVKMGRNKKIDLSDAYAKGIGDWDKVAITLAYQQFNKGTDEKKEMNKLVQAYLKKGLRFLTDQDARPEGSAHPYTHLWDNGGNAVDELNRVMEIRAAVLDNFSEKKIPVGTPLATLQEVLVPMYLFHRYQVEATAKVLGGVDYTYALRGDGQKPNEVVAPKEQLRALEALLATLAPQALVLPPKVLQLIPPHPFGYDKNPRETFNGHTGMTLDPLAPAEIAAAMTLRFLFNPQRAARLVGHHAVNPAMPALEHVLDRVVEATWKSATPAGYEGEVKRVVDQLVLQHLMQLSLSKEAAGQVRALAGYKLGELKQWLAEKANDQPLEQKAHYLFALSRIKDFEEKPETITVLSPLTAPDGAPIGMPGQDWLEMACGE